jgi:cathepsin F
LAGEGRSEPREEPGLLWKLLGLRTVANLEGAGFVANQKLLSLSEQELVDCDKATGDVGCGGGLPSNAYTDMVKNNIGLEPEQLYPYQGADGTCQASKSQEVAYISGWKAISTDEDQIAAALMKYGPLAIGINAGPMQFYFGGISNPWTIFCNPKSLDHGVAIVGFGVEASKKFWVIRNSWGSSWGEKGYYRIIRGTGACGLNTMVTTATGITFKGQDSLLV